MYTILVGIGGNGPPPPLVVRLDSIRTHVHMKNCSCIMIHANIFHEMGKQTTMPGFGGVLGITLNCVDLGTRVWDNAGEL